MNLLIVLEEQVTVVYNLCIKNQILHKATRCLHVLLHTHLHLLSLVVLDTCTHCFVYNLEDIYASIAFNRIFREFTCCCCCYCTRECRLCCTGSLNEDWRCKSYLVNFANLCALCFCCSYTPYSFEFSNKHFSLLVFDNFTFQNVFDFCIVPWTITLWMYLR